MTAPPPAGPGGLSETAGAIKDKIRDTASGMAERLGETWESTREGMRQGAQAVARTAQNFWMDAGNLIRRNPMAAVAVAFGAGCLVGCFMRASWRSSEEDVTQRMSRASA
jgi:ElaB/YqjD/DUF883 family membrane-anchored ribosome-binding protein